MDRNSGIGEVHGDAAAHGAAAEDRGGLDRLHGRVGGDIRDLGRLALGEEGVPLPLGLLGLQALQEILALLGHALVVGQRDRVLDALDAAIGRDHAARLARDAFAGRLEDLGRPLRIDRQLARLAQRPPLGHEPFGKRDRAFDEVALDHLVEQAQGERRVGRPVCAVQDDRERRRDADQARQALGAAGAGQQPQLDLRQAETRALVADPVVAAERQLEPAAHRRAVDRGDDRFRAVLGGVDHLAQVRGLEGLAELLDVGTAGETASTADQHHGLDVRVFECLHEMFRHALAHRRAHRVDRRIVKEDDPDRSTLFVADQLSHAPLPVLHV